MSYFRVQEFRSQFIDVSLSGQLNRFNFEYIDSRTNSLFFLEHHGSGKELPCKRLSSWKPIVTLAELK